MPSGAKDTDSFEVVENLNEAETSRMYSYALQLYLAMHKEAVDGVYAGKVVETFNKLKLSQSHYSRLFSSLKELGCIELLDRGVRGRPTRYRMHGAPDRDTFDRRYTSGLTGGAKPAIVPLSELEQRLANLERRLMGLDIKEIVADHEVRIATLEIGGSKENYGKT